MTAPSNQRVGQSLELQCNLTTVRGINSQVDIVWSNGSIELSRTTATTLNNLPVYINEYTIPVLRTDYNGNVIQCQVVINASPTVMVSDSTTLDVTGE